MPRDYLNVCTCSLDSTKADVPKADVLKADVLKADVDIELVYQCIIVSVRTKETLTD